MITNGCFGRRVAAVVGPWPATRWRNSLDANGTRPICLENLGGKMKPCVTTIEMLIYSNFDINNIWMYKHRIFSRFSWIAMNKIRQKDLRFPFFNSLSPKDLFEKIYDKTQTIMLVYWLFMYHKRFHTFDAFARIPICVKFYSKHIYTKCKGGLCIQIPLKSAAKIIYIPFCYPLRFKLIVWLKHGGPQYRYAYRLDYHKVKDPCFGPCRRKLY